MLGLKGSLSGAELHLLRSRMTEGLRAKAARGEWLTLPAGLDYDDGDHVIITPDEAAREAITCVFRRFDQLGSARQVVVSLRADGLRLPRRDIRTGKITWRRRLPGRARHLDRSRLWGCWPTGAADWKSTGRGRET